MVLAVFGDVDEAEARRMVEERFGSMHQAPDFRPPSPPAEKPLERTDAVTLPRQKRNLGTVFVGYSGLRVQDRQDRYVMDVIDAITSGVGVPSGWLHHALRGDKQGLVYEVHAFHVPGVDPGYFGAYAACKPDHVQEVAETIRRQIARALDDAIEQKDLDTAKETCVTARQLGDQTAGAQAMEAVLDELYGLGYDASERYAEGIRSVTVEDIRRVARKHLAHSLTVVVVPAQGVKAE
jgi:zinc protease